MVSGYAIYTFVTMAVLCMVGYAISLTETAALLERLSLIQERTEEELALIEKEGEAAIKKMLKDYDYCVAFWAAVRNGFTFNGVKCEGIKEDSSRRYTFIGKVLCISDYSFLDLNTQQIADFTTELTILTELDPCFQGSPKLFIIHVSDYQNLNS